LTFAAIVYSCAAVCHAQLDSGIYVGSVASSQTVQFGGPPYCYYQATLTSIQMSLNIAGPSIAGGFVSCVMTEMSIDNCPFGANPPVTNSYYVSSGSIAGGQITAAFSSNPGNYPGCSLNFTGTQINANTMSGTLAWQRIDQPSLCGNGLACLDWSISVTPTLTNTAPAITSQPSGQTVAVGGNAAFHVTATGPAPLSYQWQFNAGNLTDGSGISGSASSALMLTGVTHSEAGTYQVIVSNSGGSVTSSPAILIVTAGAGVIGDQPLAAAGYNQDVVVERSATGGNTAPYITQAFDVANNFGFYEAGLVATNYTGGNATLEGLPQGGLFTSALDGATVFQLGPYTGNNVLYMDAASPSGTLSLATPAACASISILATSANGGGSGSFVINFQDGSSSSPIGFNAPDWYNNPGAAISHFGRIYLGIYSMLFTDNPPGANPSLYQTSVNLASLGLNLKAIASLTFTMPSGAGTSTETDTGIFALSGTIQPLAPSVSITSPTNGAVFTAPATVSIVATASSSSARVTNVQFLVNGTVIGNSTAPPYTATDSNLAAGGYTLSAVATDSNGLEASNSVQVTVNAPAPVVTIVSATNMAENSTLSVPFTVANVPPNFAASQIAAVPSNTNLVASVGITGSGSNFTATITLAPYKSGSSTITIEAQDASGVGLSSMTLTVTPVEYAPALAPIPGTNTEENVPVNVVLSVTDPATSIANLTYTASFSGITLIQAVNFSFNGVNEIATVVPAPNQTGSATITISVSDGVVKVSQSFAVQVNGVAPMITSQPTGQTVTAGSSATFSVTATGTPPLSYQWQFDGSAISGATASGLTLSNAQPANAGSYSVMITNAFGSIASGAATLTVNGPPSVNIISPTNGAVFVAPATIAISATASGTGGQYVSAEHFYTNSAAINIVDVSPSIPSPSTLSVSGLAGLVSQVIVTVNNFGHQYPSDVGMLLVGPNGSNTVLMNNAGTGFPVSGLSLTFSQSAATPVPAAQLLSSGTFLPSDYQPFKPYNFETSGLFNPTPPNPLPPPGPYPTNLDVFNGLSPNANWYLYVQDDSPGDVGFITNGWTLELLTQVFDSVTVTNVQFVVNGAVIGNSTTAPFSAIAGNLAAGSYTLSAVATDSNGLKATNMIQVTVTAAQSQGPMITSQPTNKFAWSGTTNSFSVLAVSTAPLSYQWQANGTPLVDGGNISGSATAKLTLAPVVLSDATSYSVVISNAFGSITSSVVSLAVGTLSYVETDITYGDSIDIAFSDAAISASVYSNIYSYPIPGYSVFSPPYDTILNAGLNNILLTFIPTDTNTYSVFSTNVSLEVDQAPLDLSVPGGSRPYGEPTPGSILQGKVLNQVADQILVAVSCNASPSSPPGQYPLVVGFQDTSNPQGNNDYYIDFGDSYIGMVTVTPPDVSAYTTPPANDNFSNRITLTGANPVGTGNNFGATMERGEPDPSGGITGVTHSVWWSWVAPGNGLVRLNADGSSFETFVNVYTGSTVSNLTSIASNLNEIVGESGLSNQVSFSATAGTTYQIAINGFAEGTISFVIQPVTFQVLSLETNVNNADLTVAFDATVQIDNAGLAAVGPLRLELVARAGTSWQAASNPNPPDPSEYPPDTSLGVFPLSNPASLASGTTASIPISGICPAPTNNAGGFFGWGVFILLEEQLGTNWFAVDQDLLLYGVWPQIGAFNGPGGGVIRLDPSYGISPPTIISSNLIGSNQVFESTRTNYYSGTVTFDNLTTVIFSDTSWQVSSPTMTISSNGLFQPGAVITNTLVTLTGYYEFNGQTNGVAMSVLVLCNPTNSMSAVSLLANGRMQFTLNTLPDAAFAIDATTSLSKPVSWTALATNRDTGPLGIWFTNDVNFNNFNTRTNRFYRARLLTN
jgi:subtilisin-like proprotein convertase family protein